MVKKMITQSILNVAYKTCRSRGELAKALKGTMTGGRGARQTRRRSRSQTKVMWPTHTGTTRGQTPSQTLCPWTDASSITTAPRRSGHDSSSYQC